MAVLNAHYKHPQSAYSQGLKKLIDSMLKVNPAERPDINEVCIPVACAVCKPVDNALVGDRNDGYSSPQPSLISLFPYPLSSVTDICMHFILDIYDRCFEDFKVVNFDDRRALRRAFFTLSGVDRTISVTISSIVDH
jgi:hypothetical protein